MSSGAMSPSKNISYWKPEHPPGRTATRSASSGSPSASSSSLTLSAAESVRVIIVWFLRMKNLSSCQCNLAVGNVGQRTEVGDLGVAHRVDEALDEPAMKRTHEVGMRFRERAERAMGEPDDGRVAVVVRINGGVEALAAELGDERFHAARRMPVAGGLGSALATSDLVGVRTGGADLLGQAHQHRSD